MKAVFKIKDPNSVEVEMSITMTLGDWKKLRTHLNESESASLSPSWQLITAIRDLTAQAEAKFEHSEQEEKKAA